jgi:hypothetical protein
MSAKVEILRFLAAAVPPSIGLVLARREGRKIHPTPEAASVSLGETFPRKKTIFTSRKK